MTSSAIKPSSSSSFSKLLFGIIIFLLITDGYRFTTFVPVLSVSRFSALSTVMLLIYGFRDIRRYAKQLDILALLFATTVAWPVISAAWAPAPTLRDIGIQLHLFAIFVGSSAFLLRHPGSMYTIPIKAILFSTAFALLSLVFPDAFRAFAEEAEARYDFRGRAFGLFLQPNRLAHSLCLIYAVFLLAPGRPPLKAHAVATALLLICVGLSGSRAGMLTAVLLVGATTAAELHSTHFAFLQKRKSRLLFMMFSISILMIGAVTIGGDRVNFGERQNLQERIASIYNKRARKDTRSIEARTTLAKRYLNAAQQKPLIGHGLGSSYFFVTQRRLFENRSHNGAIEVLYLYGLVGLALWAMMLTAFCFGLQWQTFVRSKVLNIGLFVAVLLLAATANTFIVNRVLFFLLGAMYAMHLHNAASLRVPGGTLSCLNG